MASGIFYISLLVENSFSAKYIKLEIRITQIIVKKNKIVRAYILSDNPLIKFSRPLLKVEYLNTLINLEMTKILRTLIL